MDNAPHTPLAYTIDEFCKLHRLSRSSFYNLMRAGTGPRTFRIGSKVLISAEAAADWRRQMETGTPVPSPSSGGTSSGRIRSTSQARTSGA